jgi:iron complex outermembrane receptor protein
MTNATATHTRGRTLTTLVLGAVFGLASAGANAGPPVTAAAGGGQTTAAGAATSAHASQSQHDGEALVSVAGIVHDKTGRPLAEAAVAVGGQSTKTDTAGRWSLLVAAGAQGLVVSQDGFETMRRDLRVAPGLGPVEVTLVPLFRLRENVVVQAVRAEERTPVTKTDVDHEQIEALNRGQEMPFLLGTAPAVSFQADAGNPAGYAYFNIRGISQTRLNITLDGIPLQDPEDQALYFSDFGDFASVVDSVQIQRGVGTSSVGSASYGGSVNFASVNPSDRRGLEAQVGGGSWGSARGTMALNSGRLASFALYGRASGQTTDGFREHSGVDQHTFYFGATRQDERSLFKLFGFAGDERTQLAYLATDEATLKANLRTNPLTPQENDHFGMDVVHAQYTRLVGSASTLMAQAYYNGARGWFNIWDTTQTYLQRYGLDGYLVGLVLGATHRQGRLGLNWGAHVNDFSRDHFMDVVGGSRAYLNNGRKNEFNTFLKATWDAGRAQLWADGQVRHARFEYRGDIPLGSVSWTFFNPKGGIRFDPSPSIGLYASIGRMSREPARSDILNGEDNASVHYDLTAVKPERVTDGEAGVEWHRSRLVARADVYAMEFADEIALTGELSEIGLPVRRNAGRSHRRGVELDVTWTPSQQWRLGGNASLSRNRIEAWTQYYDVYDAAGNWLESVPQVHRDVPPLLTPEVILNGTLDWTPGRDLGVGLAGRFVDAAQLDNTGNPAFRTPSYFDLGARATIGLRRLVKRGEPTLRVQVTNLLDNRRIWPAGYSYLFFTRDADGRDTLSGTAYYYPLATRSVYVTLDVRF